MFKRLRERRRAQTVMGHRLPEPRPTAMAAMWGLLYVGLPVLALGLLLDFLVQWVTGRCIGLWCYF